MRQILLVCLLITGVCPISGSADCGKYYNQIPLDERAFLAGIAANPKDRTMRLVYADYIEAKGQIKAAEAMRLAATLESYPRTPENLAKIRELEAQLRAVTPEALKEWENGELGIHLARVGTFSGIGKEGLPILSPHSVESLLAATPEQQSSITGLSLGYTHRFTMPAKQAEQLAALNLSNVVHLSLDSVPGMSPDMVEALAAPNSSLKNVNTLNIRGQDFGDAGLKALTSAASVFKNVQNLKLASCEITPAGVARLGTEFSPFKNLESLSLSANPIGDAGAQAIATNPKFKNLQTLEINFCDLSAKGVEHLAGKDSQLQNVTRLILGPNLVGNEGAAALSGKNSPFGKLVELDISYANLGPDGVAAIVGKNTKLKNLSALHIGRNAIGVEGIKHLTDKSSGVTLQELSLNNSNIGDAGAAALALPQSALGSLRSIRLTANDITAVGVAKLCAPSTGLTNLNGLKLTGNPVRNAGVAALTTKDSGLKKLKNLDLSDTRITDDAAVLFLAEGSALKDLHSIEVDANYFTPEVEARIKAHVLEK